MTQSSNQDQPPILYDPQRGWRIWAIEEIYQGPNTGRYVPNVGDLIVDLAAGFFRVTSVDHRTGRASWVKWRLPGQDSGVTNQDILLGVDVGRPGESFRALINDRVWPYRLSLDGRLHVYRSTADHVKVFRGTDISATGVVISAIYDVNQQFVSENIPLERVALSKDLTNESIWSPQDAYSQMTLEDGEVVTAVVYDDAGGPISQSQLLVQNTSFIRKAEAGLRYVTDIGIESPFISEQADRRLEFPTNMPIDRLPVTGVVYYSDGSSNRLPIDGGAFELLGLSHFIANTAGESVNLNLIYHLGESEQTQGANGANAGFISRRYEGLTTPFKPAYSIQLLPFPEWQGDLYGYRLRFFLTTLDRRNIQEVTSLVELTGNSPAFEPLSYGNLQRLTYAVNMQDVDGSYPVYRHVETVDIVLKSDGSKSINNWAVGFSPDQNPRFGQDVAAKVGIVNQNYATVELDQGLTTAQEWLNHLYYATKPLYQYEKETKPSEPNMFALVVGDHRYVFELGDWNAVLAIGQTLDQGQLLRIEFILRQYQTDLMLSVAGLPVHIVDPPANRPTQVEPES